MPARIKKDTDEYLNNHDQIARFIDDSLEITNNDNDCISASQLYEMFRVGLDHNQKNNWTTQNFKAGMLNKGIKWKHTKKDNVYVGLKYAIIECQELSNDLLMDGADKIC